MSSRPDDDYTRYRDAIADEPLPCAIVDLDVVEANATTLLRHARGVPLRLATKSIRCPELAEHIVAHGGAAMRGLMTYTATETAFWHERGVRDLLLAYPTAQRADADILARLGNAAIVANDVAHLEALSARARVHGTRVPVVVEMDLAYRPLGVGHLGVRRSPLREIGDVVAFARRVENTSNLRFHGVMGYEAQIAGVPDDPLVRRMKARSRRDVAKRRAAVAEALRAARLAPTLFNGGGSGSLDSASREPHLTEVTAGSGFLDPHLFDRYDALPLAPAIHFALQVVRRPAPGFVTCLGGGYVASGGAGKSRLPRPALPEGLSLLDREGAGEVQTPLRVKPAATIPIGAPVFFRHAKAGELAEHFDRYLFVRGDRIVGRAPTYRGLGGCFLG